MDLKEKDGIRGCSLKRTVLGEEWMIAGDEDIMFRCQKIIL